jgi:putative Mn2+ efflux pump MntP
VAGAIFYTFALSKSFCYGFFTSVSVGYGIYWHPLDHRDELVVAYSALHLLLGSAMIGLAMAAFASSLTASTADW